MYCRIRLMISIVICGALLGCGIHVPQVEEVWEREPWQPVAINDNLELNIKKRVFCDLVAAIRSTHDIVLTDTKTGKTTPALPDNYGVQMQLTLTIEEDGALNPNVGATQTLANAKVHGVAVPQSIGVNFNGVLSSAATRVDTSYAYYNVTKISGRDKNGNFTVRDENGELVNSWCNKLEVTGSSLLISSDLGIDSYLRKALFAAVKLHSSSPSAAAKDSKLDIFSYEVKFVVITTAGVNPVIKIHALNVGGGNPPLLNLSRTRTHDLILTFGPGVGSPIAAALATHFSGRTVPLPPS